MLVGAIIVLITGLVVWRMTKNDPYGEPGATTFFFCAMAVMAIYIIGAIVMFVYPVFVEREVEQRYNYPLVSLEDGSKTSGSFFLGSGYIGEHKAFSYYREAPDGGLILDDTYAADTTVYEDVENPEDAYIVKYHNHPLGNCLVVCIPYLEQPYWEIHVPENTVIREIRLDTE